MAVQMRRTRDEGVTTKTPAPSSSRTSTAIRETTWFLQRHFTQDPSAGRFRTGAIAHHLLMVLPSLPHTLTTRQKHMRTDPSHAWMIMGLFCTVLTRCSLSLCIDVIQLRWEGPHTIRDDRNRDRDQLTKRSRRHNLSSLVYNDSTNVSPFGNPCWDYENMHSVGSRSHCDLAYCEKLGHT